MKMSQGKDFATSFTTVSFMVVGLSGVMIFFHLFDNYVKDLHEILGLFFVAVVFLHVVFNWKSMKNYFSKKIFNIALVFALLVSIGFVFSSSSKGENPKGILIESVLKAPLNISTAVLNIQQNEAIAKLELAGIKIVENSTIDQIAKANQTSPFKIVAILTSKDE